jgi:murein DD-endopeptidase MepM/ murein hydrolase activator NlpD
MNLERYRPYNGRRSVSHRRRSVATYKHDDRSSRRAVKLFICAGLFVIAAVTKLLFPSALEAVGEKINSVVNYRAALTALGQGFSGEKKFTAALGEAFTYAFTGEPADTLDNEKKVQVTEDLADGAEAGNTTAETNSADMVTGDTEDEAKAVFSENDTEAVPDSAAAAPSEPTEEAFSNAVIAAFLESQEEYSDYAIPAGVTYEMPRIVLAYEKPVEGEVSSTFGYRIHPIEKTIKFHYGTDIGAKKGTPITAFADGKVIAVGESTTFGKYVVLGHGDVETKYAHCDSISVESGQTVKKGDRVAAVGDTGNATEACLHFEMKVSGQYVNPEYYVQWN